MKQLIEMELKVCFETQIITALLQSYIFPVALGTAIDPKYQQG